MDKSTNPQMQNQGQQGQGQQQGSQQTQEQGSASSDQQGGKYSIGVIGTGHEGTAVIRRLVQLGHQVCMANATETDKLKDFANEIGANAEELNKISDGADMLFLCVPFKEVKSLPKEIFSKCSGKCIIVDTCNYFPSRDGQIQELDQGGTPESVWVSKQIGKPVVKALNSILAPVLESQGRPKGSQGRIAVPVSGDDSSAKRTIMDLVDKMGFDPYDAGDLASSWRQQPGSPAYCTNLSANEIGQALSSAQRELMPQKRDEAYRKMTSSDKTMEWNELVQMLRETFNNQQQKQEKSFGQQQQGSTQQAQAPAETQA